MKKISIILMLSFISIQSYAAVFTLKFIGSNGARVSVGGKAYELSTRRNSINVDTGGIDFVPNVIWTESLITNQRDAGDFNVIESDYQFDFPQKLHPWHLGGTFTIGDNGQYAYEFGLAGSQTDFRTARKTGGPRKVY